jgi:hypothetical protein
MLSFVRAVNSEINNTSLVLAFDGFGHRMLFTGDAEVDSWRQMLADSKIRKFIAGTTVYKVSHHGSGNGTPRSVWNLIARPKPAGRRLVTLLSTKSGIHGSESKQSEVPRADLVHAMESQSVLFDTRNLGAGLRAAGARYAELKLTRQGVEMDTAMIDTAA